MFWKSLSLCSVFVFACHSPEAQPGQWPATKAELAAGRTEVPGELTYRRYCTGCHGADGHGGGGTTGADLAGGSSPLLRKSDAELAVSVRDGKRGALATMPAHKPVLSDSEIDVVIAYARQRFAPQAPGQVP